jgi:hypothetical protein
VVGRGRLVCVEQWLGIELLDVQRTS